MSIVQRFPADKPGDEIVSPILISSASQIERGRQEINYNSTDRVLRTCTLALSDFILPGELVAIQDNLGVTSGMLTDIDIKINSKEMTTSITVEFIK